MSRSPIIGTLHGAPFGANHGMLTCPIEPDSRSCGDKSVMEIWRSYSCSHQAITAFNCCLSKKLKPRRGRDCCEIRPSQRTSTGLCLDHDLPMLVFQCLGSGSSGKRRTLGHGLPCGWYLGTWVLGVFSFSVCLRPLSCRSTSTLLPVQSCLVNTVH